MSNRVFKHNEFEIFKEFWSIYKAHYQDRTIDQSEIAIAELNKLSEKYIKSPLTCPLAELICHDLNRQWHENNGDTETVERLSRYFKQVKT